MGFIVMEKGQLEKIDRLLERYGGSSAGEPGASAVGQAGNGSKLRFRRINRKFQKESEKRG